MKTVSILREEMAEWVVVEIELKTNLEFNSNMDRIVEMAEEGLIAGDEMYNKLVDEILISYGELAAHTFVTENPF